MNASPRPHRSVLGLWLAVGAAVTFSVLALVGILVVLGIALTSTRSPSGTTGPIASVAINPSPAPVPDAVPAAALAALVARELRAPDEADRAPSNAEVLAMLAIRRSAAETIAAERTPLAAIAADAARALGDLEQKLSQPPSAQPLTRSGIDAVRQWSDESESAFLLGLLGIGDELSKLGEYSDELSTIHARIVACRIRLSAHALTEARETVAGSPVGAEFLEARGIGTVEDDTLVLSNSSGRPLTDVMVAVELHGHRGTSFTNLFYRHRWEAGQIMLAVCPSGPPFRETVSNVSRVRFRVLSNELVSPQFELTLR